MTVVRLLCVLLIIGLTEISAGPGYLMSLSNCEKVSDDTYEFDVLIKSTGASFEITSYQCAFSLNPFLLNGGNAVFTFINGTSDLTGIPPSAGIKLDSIDNMYEITFASYPGSEMISTAETRLGRFRLGNSVSCASMDPNFTWNFEGVLSTIITGTAFTVITNPSYHLYNFLEIQKLNVLSASASATTDPDTSPGKTIDGSGYFGSDPNSRWAANPMPHWITYDLGTPHSICQVRISFFNFHAGRVYSYSVYASEDSVNWIEVVLNNNSIPAEWTINNFTLIPARYIRVDCLSSTNNPANWANIWEAEIWGLTEPIPVELLGFTVDVVNNVPVLKWETATELNNYGFEVERSFDSNTWTKIGFVEGSGSSNYVKNYEYIDKELNYSCKRSYRLKQVDFNGEYSYSSVVEINIDMPEKFQLMQNFPNPFNPSTTIKFSLPEKTVVKIDVYNLIGELVNPALNEIKEAGTYSIDLEFSNLPSGVYLYRMEAGGKIIDAKKMILVR